MIAYSPLLFDQSVRRLPDVTIGNPCPVYDAATGITWLAFTRDNDRVFVTSSADDGLNWAEPAEISNSVTLPNWVSNCYFTGPGHGLQLSYGENAGRLIFPSCHFVDEGTRVVLRSHMIYSDDHGSTWQIGESTAIGPDINPDAIHIPPGWIPEGYDWEGGECMAVEALDGRLYLTIRNQTSYQGKKAYSWSYDGGVTWQPVGLQDDLPGLATQSSIIKLPDSQPSRPDRFLFCGITDRTNDRAGLRLFISEDEVDWAYVGWGDQADYCMKSIPGDANCDGKVDDVDATILATNWLRGPDATWYMGDFNCDGTVSGEDAMLLAANWLKSVSASASAPEPGCLVLLGAMSLMSRILITRRRKKN